MSKFLIYLAWAWVIIIGGLMFTPGGLTCIACGAALNNLIAIVSIAIGVVGFATQARSVQAT
jgi:hypothetical protein